MFKVEGTVGPNAGSPSHYLWSMLAGAEAREELEALKAHALAQGYSQEGQLVQAIEAKLGAQR